MNKRSSILAFAFNLISLVSSVMTCNMLLPALKLAQSMVQLQVHNSSATVSEIWLKYGSLHSDSQSSSSSLAAFLVLCRGNAQNHRGAHLNGLFVLISPSNVYLSLIKSTWFSILFHSPPPDTQWCSQCLNINYNFWKSSLHVVLSLGILARKAWEKKHRGISWLEDLGSIFSSSSDSPHHIR